MAGSPSLECGRSHGSMRPHEPRAGTRVRRRIQQRDDIPSGTCGLLDCDVRGDPPVGGGLRVRNPRRRGSDACGHSSRVLCPWLSRASSAQIILSASEPAAPRRAAARTHLDVHPGHHPQRFRASPSSGPERSPARLRLHHLRGRAARTRRQRSESHRTRTSQAAFHRPCSPAWIARLYIRASTTIS